MPVRPRPYPDINPQPSPDSNSNNEQRLREKLALDECKRRAQNYPQWDAARYQSAVGGTFDGVVLSNSDYSAALLDAASQNKPVVMLIGKSSEAATRQVVENSLKEAHSRCGKDAVFVFVDMDRVERSSSMGKYAFENMPRKGQEPPFLMIFGLARGENANSVKAEALKYHHMGEADSAAIAKNVSSLKQEMNGRFNLPRPESKFSDQQKNLKPFADEKKMQEEFAKSLLQARQEPDKESAFKLFQKAVDIADAAKSPRLQAVSRVELGLACMSWGFRETGFKWILEGASKNPELYDERKNAAFKERLTQAGVPPQALELLLRNGKENPNWWIKDPNSGKLIDDAAKSGSQVKPSAIFPPPLQLIPQADKPHIKPSPFK
jgi:hypothetical protein